MIKHIKYETLGSTEFSWLKSKHHFSFGEYRDPARLGHGELIVINDDIISSKTGFDLHPHKDMEIITYVRKGAITHKDNQGNSGRTVAGDIQVMSAGSGIYHSEYNYEDTETKIFQIWIMPNKKGLKPSWNTITLSNDVFHKYFLPLLISGDGKSPLHINQNVKIYGGKIKNTTIKHELMGKAYVLMSSGEARLGKHLINEGDGVSISNLKNIEISTKNEAEMLIIDVPGLLTRN